MSPYDTRQYAALKEFWYEPDAYEGIERGFKVVARRNRMKAWCGYVGVPETHSLYGKDYSYRIPVSDRETVVADKAGPISLLLEVLHEDDGQVSLDVLLNVHGGITYAGGAWWAKDDPLWYFGFDCSHAGDLTPQDVFLSFSGGIWESHDGVYRSLDYVKEELISLSTQLEQRA